MCGVPLDDWANDGSVNVFFMYVSIILVLWGVVATLGNLRIELCCIASGK